MNYFFTYQEGSLLVKLLIAHLITDFLLQSKKSIHNKNEKKLKSLSFWMHGFYTGVFTGLAMWGDLNIPILCLIIISHLVIDYIKLVFAAKENLTGKYQDFWIFILDQLLHIFILVLGWLVIINGFEKMSMTLHQLSLDYKVLLRILGYLTVIGPLTYMIKFLTTRWANEVAETGNSLDDAGKWIGVLERLIIITLVFIGEYTALGFLITAKSILRLIDKPENSLRPEERIFSTRKHTEYVLIGTFLSFSSAILVGLVINWLLNIAPSN